VRDVVFCVFLAQASAPTAVPPQPDFSGHWVLVVALPSNALVPAALVVRQSIRRTNVRGEPMTPFYDRIDLDRESATGTVTESIVIGISGGTVGGVVNARGAAPATSRPPRSHYAVGWKGRTLVFEAATYTGDSPDTGDWSDRREAWALQPNGELAIDIATSSSADRTQTVSATYRRRE
jgi:hypothetical protein